MNGSNPPPVSLLSTVLASMAGALEGLDATERARVRALLADIRRTVNSGAASPGKAD